MNILTTMKNITKMCGKQTKIKICFIRTRIEKHWTCVATICFTMFHPQVMRIRTLFMFVAKL